MEVLINILQQNSVRTTQNKPKFCSVCKEAVTKEVEFSGQKFTVSVSCKCQRDKLEQDEEKRRQQEKMQRIEKLKSLSLLGERYKNVTFENSEIGLNSSFDTAFERCKKYCELHKEITKNGCGIYLHGDKGVGKTHITACMANYLLSQCVPVLFTNLFEISKVIKSTFNRESRQTERDLIEKFSNIPILFFDDLGTELFAKSSGETWLQCLLFDLINKRYNNKKSTIFSSNYSLNSLINKRGIAERTVDRINEITSNAVMKITGHSLRRKFKNEILF